MTTTNYELNVQRLVHEAIHARDVYLELASTRDSPAWGAPEALAYQKALNSLAIWSHNYLARLEWMAHAGVDFWEKLQVREDQPLPLFTIRQCCPGKSCGGVELALRHRPDGLLEYLRVSNLDVYWGPCSELEIRARLADETWRAR